MVDDEETEENEVRLELKEEEVREEGGNLVLALGGRDFGKRMSPLRLGLWRT